MPLSSTVPARLALAPLFEFVSVLPFNVTASVPTV